MSNVKIYSNFVKKANAIVLDSDSQREEVLSIVNQALDNGAKEIFFNYEENGPECESSPEAKIIESGTTPQRQL
jgi:hypothetical protein